MVTNSPNEMPKSTTTATQDEEDVELGQVTTTAEEVNDVVLTSASKDASSPIDTALITNSPAASTAGAGGDDEEGATGASKVQKDTKKVDSSGDSTNISIGISLANDDNKASEASSPSSSSSFPKAFYCPITKKVLEDPVVSSDGFSYERAALLSSDDNSNTVNTSLSTEKLYDNRALKSIIDEAVEYKTSSGLKRFQQSVLQFSQQLISTPGFHRPLPDGYYCPITLGLIHVPVVDPEGYSYEKVAIENWIRYNGASPVTRRALTVEELVPNRTLAALMEEEKAKSEDMLHPMFKQYKEEPLPVAMTGAGEVSGGSTHGSTAAVVVPAPATFPTTPEELEAANRRRRIRRYRRCQIWTVLAIVLGVLAWMVPVLATTLLVLIMLGIAIVTGYSSSSDFRPANNNHHRR